MLDEARPIGGAERQDVVVEIVARRVNLVDFAVGIRAVADAHEDARLLLQHEGEILAGAELDIADIRFADNHRGRRAGNGIFSSQFTVGGQSGS